MVVRQDEIDDYLAQILGEDLLGEDLPSPSVVARDNSGLSTDSVTHISPEQYYALAASHGGVMGTFPIDPIVSEHGVNYFGDPVQNKIPNPNPRYKVQFADGTSMVYQSIRMPSTDGQQGTSVGVNVIDGGTAMKASITKPIAPDDLTPNTSARFIPRRMPDGSITWEKNENYIEPKGPQPSQRVPQTQAEMDADAARTRLYAAQATKAEHDLQDPYILKQQQMDEVIRNIADQYARNEISIQDRDKLMLYARQNLDASMRGTTPFQMEQDRLNREQQRRTQQQNLAQKLIDSQLQQAGSMGQGFLTGLGGIYSKIRSSAFQGDILNPLDMTRTFMNEYGAGQGLSDEAKAILLNAFQQPQPPQGDM